METNIYINPLITRYASREMAENFSDDKKYRLWRKLWIALAESEKELGLNISDEQIDDLKKYADDINYDVANEYEKEVRHDVMAHVKAYGFQAKKAAGIIHLGATSCFVTDNAEINVFRKQNGQLFFRNRLNTALVAIYNRNWRPPVSLA